MIVYRGQERPERTGALLDRLYGSRGVRDLLISFGELESGVADALCPEREAPDEALRVMSDATQDIGGALYRGDAARAWRAVDTVRALRLPQCVLVTVPEGYAYYALYPEAYVEAAREFYRAERPAAATVIGIRSIGTSLSGAVAGTLAELGCETRSFSVRPRGHPFDRRIAATPEFEAEVRRWSHSWFAVADEGPGLSGSSFASVAAWLSSLGIPDGRVVFFPSWMPDGSGFVSETARERWGRHRKYSVPFEAVWRPPWPGMDDLSAGKWRSLSYQRQTDYPAVNPHHERRKYLRPGRQRLLLKFAGLGEHGRSKLTLASQSGETGFCPAPEGLYDGFLATRFEEGRPLTAADANAALIETFAEYLAFRRRAMPGQRGASFDELLEMAAVNSREGLGEGAEGAIELLERFRPIAGEESAVAIDGRMLPHEWLATPRGYVKTDALDHHDDHFFPGNQDIAWDLAGCAIEFRLPPEAERRLLATYARLAADEGVWRRLPFYKASYAAFRLGYATISARALAGSEDAARFEQLAREYAQALGRALRCTCRVR